MSSLPREWPRSIHGKLVDRLVELGASVIVFDVNFHKPRSAEDEKIFADAVERSRRVVLFQQLTGKRQPVEDASGKIRGNVWVEELLSPVPPLTQAARGLGPFPLPKIEASVYEFWAFKSSAREAPTMPAVGFQLYSLKIYDRFYRLLKNSGFGRHLALPESAADIVKADDLVKMMTGIRQLIIDKPILASNLAEELKQPWVADESADNRQLLQSLVSMYTGSDSRYLNFYGPPGTIKTVPYQVVINGPDPNFTAEQLDMSDTVVFVGFSDLYDPGQPDRFYTVFTNEDSIDLSGVEIAATAFGNLFYDESLRPSGEILTLAVLFTFGICVTLIVYFAPASLGVPGSVIVTAGYAIYAQYLFNTEQIWLPIATPVLLQFPAALIVGMLAQYLEQRHKVKHISEAISLYVPAEVSRALIGNELKTESINQVTYSTCLATDMQGFSTIAEHMGPGDLAEFLNDYFDSLAKPLSDHDVTVTEFRADAIMCAWTGDESDPAIRRKPILASLQAADAIEDFKARHDAFDTSLRIGLETGEVYVGHSGGGGHFVYSIVGDCANTASRIEGLNKHLNTQILATSTTLEGIDDLLLRPVGDFVFVGKTEALHIFEILSLANEATQKQTELADRFARGLDFFMRAEWQSASTEFKTILKDFPHDGPSRFYSSECQQRLRAESLPEMPWVINMTKK
ncbi:MAG: adenylate/guanylate cyclase domain-containing protein, partial [Gammaproteobacteria bacterium]|jgi:adenylate cyclase